MSERQKNPKLKKQNFDHLDARSKLPRQIIDVVSGALIFGAVPIAAGAVGEVSLTQAFPYYAMTALGVLAEGSGIAWQLYRSRKVLTINDRKLKLSAQPLVYQGEQKLQLGSVTIEKGDNLYVLRLPTLLSPADLSKTNQKAIEDWRTRVRQDTQQYALSLLARKAKKTDYKAVVMEVPLSSDSAPDKSQRVSRQDADKLFDGKDVQAEVFAKKTLIITKEDLESQLSTDERFSKYALALEDKRVLDLLATARTLTDPDQKARALSDIQRRLDQLILIGVENSYSGSLTQPAGPTRQKIERTFTLRRNSKGITQLQIFAPGSAESIPLDKYLKLDRTNQPNEQHSTGLLKARRAYQAGKEVSSGKLDVFFEKGDSGNKNEPTRVSILSDMRVVEMALIPTKDRATAASLLNWKSYLREGTNIRPKIENLARAGLLLALVTAFDYGSGRGFPMYETDPQTIEAVFPPEAPGNRARWSVGESGGIESAGYYITSTSHDYQAGKWHVNKTRSRELSLPSSTEKPHIQISRNQFNNPLDEHTLKIPIKTGTEVSSLQVLDLNNKPVDVKIFELEDGTLELVLPFQGSNFASTWYLRINAGLVSSAEGGPHSTKRLPPIDASKLDAEPLAFLEAALNDPGNFNTILRDAVKHSHYYSLNPPGKEIVKRGQTAEERVNAIESIEGCPCMICSEELGHLFSLHPDPSVSGNYAVGYHYGGNTLASGIKDGRLRDNIGHAFLIAGREVIDPTPENSGNDAMTLESIANLPGRSPVLPPDTPQEVIPEGPTPTPNPEPDASDGQGSAAFLATLTPAPTFTPFPTFTPTPTVEPTATPSPTPTQESEQLITLPVTPTPLLIPSPSPVPPFDLAPAIENEKPWLTTENLAKGMAAVLAGALSVVGLRRYKTIIENEDGSIVLKKIRERVNLSSDEVAKAYSVLSWLSYSESSSLVVPPAGQIKSYDLYTGTRSPNVYSIRENIVPPVIARYLKNPELVENNIQGLTPEEKQKIRRFAQFLI